jgi:hemolysin III
MHGRREQIADSCVHVIGVTASVVAFATLMAVALKQGGLLLVVSSMIYGIGLVTTFGCSAVYNLTAAPARKEVLRRFDHAAIFLMIAGTYTPFTLINVDAAWALTLFVFVWLIAASGAAVKLLYPRRFERLSIALYLLLGWSVSVTFEPLLSTVSLPVIILLAAGGLLYSFGVVFHLWDRLPYQNAIWHGFVLAGAACHYAAVLDYVTVPSGRA